MTPTTSRGAGPVGLGQTLRHDAPPSLHERQPLIRGALALVADARLDDRDALCRLLGVDPAQRAALPDSVLVLRAYERWGERCPERLSGSYAFALWDGRRGALLLARDHMGQRPLSYSRSGPSLVFATDYRAVLAHPSVRREIDEEVVVGRLLRAHRVGLERTPWAGVRKLRPGSALVVEPGGVPRTTTHWRPARRPAPTPSRPEDHAEALRETLATAVGDAVRSVHPVASHLSGGLDSTTVAVLAARALAEQERSLALALSWSPAPDDGVGRDEQARIAEVVGELGVPCAYLELSPDAARRNRVRELALEPNETRLAEDVLLGRAREHGARVVLSGWGGDELPSFNARGYLAMLLRSGPWRTLTGEIVAGARRQGASPVRVARALRARIAREALPPLLPGPLARIPRGAVAPRAKGLSGLDPRAERLLDERDHRLRPRSSPRAMQLALLRNGHITMRLESWAHAAAEAGVEYRFPLLDRRVMELCLGLPEDVWMRDGWSRWLFRTAADPLLPASIAWGRPKDEPVRQDYIGGVLGGDDEVPAGDPWVVDLHRRLHALNRA